MIRPRPRGGLRLQVVAVSASFLAAGICAAWGDEKPERFHVVRLREADGTGAREIDLARIGATQAKTAEFIRASITGMRSRVEEARFSGHRAGLPACAAAGERVVALAETVPPAFRRHVLYFVRAPRGGGRPSVLPAALPEPSAVFVLEAASLADVGALAKTLRRRVTLASAEFARAMGVRCADARVEFSADGRSARVRENPQ